MKSICFCLAIFSVACCTAGYTTDLSECDIAQSYSNTVTSLCLKALAREELTTGCHGADACCNDIQQLATLHCHCLSDSRGVHADLLRKELQSCYTVRQRALRQSPEIRLFVGVLTAAKNVHARNAIRETWGAHPQLHRVLFFSAKPSKKLVFSNLRAEAVTHKDVVLLPAIWESYHNITHQTLEVLRFAAADILATHILKVDDDSYVRVDVLLEKIRAAPSSCLFMGYIENPGGGPHRNPKSPWYVTEAEWPSEKYPPWAHGAGYVISQDLVREIAVGGAMVASRHNLFKLEDISVGAWIQYVGNEKGWKINYVMDTAFNYNGCNAFDIVSHYVTPRAMLCMFRKAGLCCNKPRNQAHIRGES